MSPIDAERDRTQLKPESEADPDLPGLIREAGQNDPYLANALTQVFSALLRTMIEQERAKQQPVPARPLLPGDGEPSDAEVEAAAHALWRYDLCGMLLYSG